MSNEQQGRHRANPAPRVSHETLGLLADLGLVALTIAFVILLGVLTSYGAGL